MSSPYGDLWDEGDSFCPFKSFFNMRQILDVAIRIRYIWRCSRLFPVIYYVEISSLAVWFWWVFFRIIELFSFVLCAHNQRSCYFLLSCVTLSTLQDESETLWVLRSVLSSV